MSNPSPPGEGFLFTLDVINQSMTLTRAQAEALLGPRPPSRTPEYSRWRYRLTRLLHPQKYERMLALKRKTP